MSNTDALQEDQHYSPTVEDWLTPHPTWAVQSFEYYAAHFLVGTGLTCGRLENNIKALAKAMQKQYDIGVEHGNKGAPFKRATAG